MLEHSLYRDCFSSADMRSVWSQHATISAWLKVEQTLARHQALENLIPQEAADALDAISVCNLDTERLHEDMMHVGRPIVGLVEQLRRQVGDHATRVHYRATTQDIMDTALALQMKIGLEHIQTGLERLTAAIGQQIDEVGDTVMMGRTNGQHAVPIRAGTKLTVWKVELLRRAQALEESAARGLNVQIGGPVGDLRGYKNGTGHRIKEGVAATLGLNVIEPHWQNARDGIADIVGALGGLCATLCKISHNVNLLSSSDISEWSEVHVTGKGASSAMAHKQNQRASEFGEAVARLGRQRAEQIGEFTTHQHERSGGMWIGEWIVVPETFLLTSGALSWVETIFANLMLDTDSMARKVSDFDHAAAAQPH
ncbi:lyase family protein [Ruegeria sp. Ofav3-42]|uniref:lyase family protein n=1 Tax=Ruegeria sp. Ofav3-42 TaxID=2917759 RepID=UPI001EF56725|nr:lyase family protein [Ruegeria sp. Ofav3-42]MCG7519941.1 hypothetical protein [Ruegeria sp. Ofav3-42]